MFVVYICFGSSPLRNSRLGWPLGLRPRLIMPVEKSKKRKASPVQVDTPRVSAKRARIVSPPPPVVLDEFETEAKREVDASAGLTGSQIAAGQKLSLSHQVCNNILPSLTQLSTLLRSGIKSRFPKTTTTPPYRPMFQHLLLLGHILSLLIPFSKSLSTPSSAMRAYWFPPIPVPERR